MKIWVIIGELPLWNPKGKKPIGLRLLPQAPPQT
jgi:hypothetical protein